MFKTPVLLLLWRRPEYLQAQIDVLKKVQVSKLFIACDGYTGNKLVDRSVQEVRAQVNMLIDWDCDLKLLYRDDCIGCKEAVSQSISWFFSFVDNGIILEDDCLPLVTFFEFCQYMLDRFRSEQKVMMVSGRNEQGSWRADEYDYFYSDGGIWGWATWADRWKRYDGDLIRSSNKEALKSVRDYFGSRVFYQLMLGFNSAVEGRVDSWAYPWKWRRALDGGLSITPTVNLVKNVGFNKKGSTHTKERRREKPLKELDGLDFSRLRGPEEMRLDKEYAYAAIAESSPLHIAYRYFIGRIIAIKWSHGKNG